MCTDPERAVFMIGLIRLIEVEVGPVGLTARVNIENLIEAIYDEYDDGGWWIEDGGGPDDPEPDPPVPPDDDGGEKPDLYALFDLKVLV